MSAVDVDKFGKVAVLMGGDSSEREISLMGGQAVFDALLRSGVNVHCIDVGGSLVDDLKSDGYDRVFIMLHGKGGEDGSVQGLLEYLDIVYTGADVLGSALTLNKYLSKNVWQADGLPTPECMVLNSEHDIEIAFDRFGWPLMIKPVLEGSSIGMSKVSNLADIPCAWESAKKCGGMLIAEQFIDGDEYTAAILNGKVLPLIRLETPREFYDYEAKYESDTTRYHCPCGLTQEKEEELGRLVLRSFESVGASGWGRVDFMLDEDEQPWLIEVNTIPGMTNHSLVPMAAKEAGIGFDQLVLEILAGTMG